MFWIVWRWAASCPLQWMPTVSRCLVRLWQAGRVDKLPASRRWHLCICCVSDQEKVERCSWSGWYNGGFGVTIFFFSFYDLRISQRGFLLELKQLEDWLVDCKKTIIIVLVITLSHVTNTISLGTGLLIGEKKKQFEDVTLGFRKLYLTFFTILDIIDKKVNHISNQSIIKRIIIYRPTF